VRVRPRPAFSFSQHTRKTSILLFIPIFNSSVLRTGYSPYVHIGIYVPVLYVRMDCTKYVHMSMLRLVCVICAACISAYQFVCIHMHFKSENRIQIKTKPKISM
jgi:hypothetical protein